MKEKLRRLFEDCSDVELLAIALLVENCPKSFTEYVEKYGQFNCKNLEPIHEKITLLLGE